MCQGAREASLYSLVCNLSIVRKKEFLERCISHSLTRFSVLFAVSLGEVRQAIIIACSECNSRPATSRRRIVSVVYSIVLANKSESSIPVRVYPSTIAYYSRDPKLGRNLYSKDIRLSIFPGTYILKKIKWNPVLSSSNESLKQLLCTVQGPLRGKSQARTEPRQRLPVPAIPATPQSGQNQPPTASWVE